MRFFPLFLVIIATVAAWHSAAIAGTTTDRSDVYADDSSAGGKKDKQKGPGSDEPECE
ncbi:MAG: hypothetical protein H6958_10355 [Chromatiaceae bacterium]|nr:hypothetical protein [Chromatiaceae bacterium]